MTTTVPSAAPQTLREQILEKIAALITIAFGLVAALAWNNAIQATFDRYFGEDGTLPGLYTYAVIVTIIAVLATIWIGRAASRAHDSTTTRRARRPIT